MPILLKGRSHGYSLFKPAVHLLAWLAAFSFTPSAFAATLEGDLTVVAYSAQLLPGFDASATAIDFGDATIASDGTLDTDASTGAANSLIFGTGDFSVFLLGGFALSAQFYDFDLSGTVNSSNLLFTWDDYIVHDSGNGITTAATFGSGSLTALDFNGTGILSSASGAFDDTVINWWFGSTGVTTGELTIETAVIPLPSAFWLFGTALLGTLLGRKAIR